MLLQPITVPFSKSTLKPSVYILRPVHTYKYMTQHDTTRQHATRPIFLLPVQFNGSVHTYAARPSLVVTTKSYCNKNRSGSDFCRVSQ